MDAQRATEQIAHIRRQMEGGADGGILDSNTLHGLLFHAERGLKMAEALKPFAAYADPTGVFPPTVEITKGSRFARKQLTMGDCYEAARALEQSTRTLSADCRQENR